MYSYIARSQVQVYESTELSLTRESKSLPQFQEKIEVNFVEVFLQQLLKCQSANVIDDLIITEPAVQTCS